MSTMSDGENMDKEGPNLFNIPWEDVLVPYLGPALSVKDCFNLRCVSVAGKQLGEAILRKVHKLVLYSSLSQNRDTVQVLRKLCKDVEILTVASESKQPDQISVSNFIQLTSGLKKLRYVDLSYSSLSPRAVHHIFVNSKYMTYLDLTRCCWLTDGALQTLTVHQKHLRHLNLRCCCQLSSKSLIKLIALSPNLEKLNLQQISAVDDSVLAAILHYCENLSSLNLLMCKEISPYAIERFLSSRPSVKVKQYRCRSLAHVIPMNFTGNMGMNMEVPFGYY